MKDIDYRDIAALIREAHHARDAAMGALLAAAWRRVIKQVRSVLTLGEHALAARFGAGHPASGR